MRPDNPPAPEYAFGYARPPESGNDINGRGVRERVRPRRVFHNGTNHPLAWDALDEFMDYHNVWGVVRHIVANTWQLRKQDGPVAGPRREVPDPGAMAEMVKVKARELGAELVGIAPIDPIAVYEGVEVPFANAVCLGLSMDRDEMVHAPQPRAAVEVMRVYREVSRVAIRLAEWIRGEGWPARAYGNPNSTDILHIPLAVQAGLGQLGKHGSLISREYGSNVRLAAVLTDLPVARDHPVDIGVDDLCVSCRRCELDCPPGAITSTKQLVRGEQKWYVDFDRCIPYFVKTYGCAICIEVCPWSEPGRGDVLSEMMLRKREEREALR